MFEDRDDTRISFACLLVANRLCFGRSILFQSPMKIVCISHIFYCDQSEWTLASNQEDNYYICIAWTSLVWDSTLIMVRLMPPALLTLQAFFCVLRCISSQPPRDPRPPPPPPPSGDPNFQQNSINGHTTTSTSVSSTTHSIVATTTSTEGTPTAASYPLMGHFFRCHIDECFRCQETQQFTGSHLRCSERCCRTPTCAAYNFRPGLLTSSLSECTLCAIRKNITTEAVQKLGPGCYFCEKVVSIPIQ